ncbi:M15 family metallopeptidase [Peribacillus frigoritolerans]|nr:M15 family metallopeptidase [Peribacillus frigoritolerans]
MGKNSDFNWGGDWSGFKDYPHLEMTGGQVDYVIHSYKQVKNLLLP